jgi:hypothetical protein
MEMIPFECYIHANAILWRVMYRELRALTNDKEMSLNPMEINDVYEVTRFLPFNSNPSQLPSPELCLYLTLPLPLPTPRRYGMWVPSYKVRIPSRSSMRNGDPGTKYGKAQRNQSLFTQCTSDIKRYAPVNPKP